MSGGQNGSTAAVDAFARMWTDFATRMMSAGLTFAPESTPPEMARSVRSAAFQAMSRYAEEYMRSPQFLEAMRQSMDAAIQFKNAVNESLGRVQFELQNASRGDVDALVARLRNMETRIMDRLDDVAARVEQLERRIGGGEEPMRPAPAGTEPAPRPVRAKRAGTGGASKRGAR